MSKLFVQVERVEDLMGRADDYFGFDLCGEDSADATAFACAVKRKPPTNADRIRSMSDEELAHLLNECVCPIDPCPHYFEDRECTKAECEKCWIDWLREESK